MSVSKRSEKVRQLILDRSASCELTLASSHRDIRQRLPLQAGPYSFASLALDAH